MDIFWPDLLGSASQWRLGGSKTEEPPEINPLLNEGIQRIFVATVYSHHGSDAPRPVHARPAGSCRRFGLDQPQVEFLGDKAMFTSRFCLLQDTRVTSGEFCSNMEPVKSHFVFVSPSGR